MFFAYLWRGFSTRASRPHGLKTRATVSIIICLAISSTTFAIEPIRDWTDWQKYHDDIKHPALAIKSADLDRARENIKRYPWAQNYFESLKSTAAACDAITPQFLERMIPVSTPGSLNYTPCPSCRDQNKPFVPHGQWVWDPNSPDQVKCEVCGAVFPNEKYPENIVLRTTWGKPQELSFVGGEPFVLFGYAHGRPSFSAYIRAQKVAYMAQLARRMAEAHALGGDVRFAKGVRAILLRFAEVYPNWLVHVGYGEYADMDPHVAAASMEKFPQDELVYPPNKPDRQLFTQFWNAGRAAGSGGEGRFLRPVTEAYDLTFNVNGESGSPIYSPTDRRAIEQDLLLEGTILLTADEKINNKSMGNRTAVAMVGLCVGHPQLVSFGLDGFNKTLSEWFLADGTTPESFSYEMMALGGIVDFGQALRGYSDPPGYKDASGHRLEKIDVYRDEEYTKIWSILPNTLQGDLTFPPIADTYRGRTIGAGFVELMAANYPDRPQYLALLREACGKDSQNIDARTAIYLREPASENRKAPPLALEDFCPPELRIGFMRSGADGRESLLLLNASHWGSHHHTDSLGLYYWKNGRELLSDLGYLWDHPKKNMTSRTLAHNTVLIDEKDQEKEARGGDVQFFRASEHVKVMRASSKAYPDAKIYSRTSALIDHGKAESYAIDLFNVQGGATQDYVFHGPNLAFELIKLPMAVSSDVIYDLQKLRAADGDGSWSATWKLSNDMSFTAWSIGQSGERVMIGNGWGQRDYHNSDIGVQLPYIVRRCTGPGAKQFISVFEGFSTGRAQVSQVRKLEAPRKVTALMIDTPSGRDYIIAAPDATPIELKTVDGRIECAGEFTAISILYRRPRWAWSTGKPPKLDGDVVTGGIAGADK